MSDLLVTIALSSAGQLLGLLIVAVCSAPRCENCDVRLDHKWDLCHRCELESDRRFIERLMREEGR